MAVFHYKALKETGEVETGIIDADTIKEARTKLRALKLYPTEVTEKREKEKVPTFFKIPIPTLRRKNLLNLALVTRQLATLLNSGIPLMGALTALIDQTDDKGLKTALMDVRERVAQGVPFSQALSHNPFYFDDLYVNTVVAGEASGELDKVLFRISDHIYTQNRIQEKIKAALTYPIILLIIAAGVIGFLMTFVVPKITMFLRRQEAVLPLPTEILIVISEFIRSFWWVILLGLIFLWIFIKSLRRTEKGRLAIDTILLDIPVIGQLFKKAAISRFASTFATLLETGVQVLVALDIVARVVGNEVLKNAILDVRQKVSSGGNMAAVMKNHKVFPPVVAYMVGVGEESGRLDDLLRKISTAYDEELEISAQRLISLLEPIMIVIMAFLVAFIILSVLLPILQMSAIM
jgi:general secretion pathway protein F